MNRKQVNWKFKGTEPKEIYEWFDNQDNIALSLQVILNNAIELYGTKNILDHNIQKQMYKDTFLLQELRGEQVLKVNQDAINQVLNKEGSRLESEEKQNESKEMIVSKEEDSKSKNDTSEEQISKDEKSKEQPLIEEDKDNEDDEQPLDYLNQVDPNSF
ncbi:hypothetical protein [Metabacillus fastidiosus]|uniref:hypothetical protein n=1 Tax=Metabacillus fastidiosus TaxID=1458 RepID=UPI002E1FFA3E|nr:hypothetical protein [Metabacillus fastidiosus]